MVCILYSAMLLTFTTALNCRFKALASYLNEIVLAMTNLAIKSIFLLLPMFAPLSSAFWQIR